MTAGTLIRSERSSTASSPRYLRIFSVGGQFVLVVLNVCTQVNT